MSWRCLVLAACVDLTSAYEGRRGASLQAVSLSSSGEARQESRGKLLRRNVEVAQGSADDEEDVQLVACDSGGTSTNASPRTFEIPAPSQVPFTLSLRMQWLGDDPPKLTPNPACIVCWTIDPDTQPSEDKAQFFRGVDGQPPRIALMRMGNVLTYEEYSANGGTGSTNTFTSDKKLNDESPHEVVIVRTNTRITLWIDGKPDSFIDSGSSPRDFQSGDLPDGKPNKLTQNAATTNEYLRRQVNKTTSYNKVDPFNGNWGLHGEVTNVRLYHAELSANQFPDSKQSCEETTTPAPVVCHSSCEKCDGGTEADCLSCKGLRFMHEKKCLEECPDGRFGHKESKSCMPCHESCATCSSEEATDCQSCPSGQFLHEGCKESCPDLFFADGDSICKPLAGAVVALKTQGDKAMLVYSNDTNCVKLVELAGDEQEDPSNIDDESKMWMVAGTSKNTASFRNVKTGLALQMPSSELSQLDNSGCATEINTCAVARPPKPIPGETSLWTDNQWGVYKCDKSSFGITSHGNSIISLSLEDRYLKAGKLLGLSNQVEPGSSLGQELRFEPLFVLPAVKSLRKTSGRCQNLITQSLQCSAAAGGQAIDDFADFTEQSTDPKFPPGCYYYQQEIMAPKDKGYKDLPMTVSRLALNVFASSQGDYSRFADCSVKMPCLCRDLS
mmetsp:Transcript_98347/g.234108  ORF Transcript_98347/g.234108 Transcript_98347/m.234108 type:complete len:671 (-) Transcript_98347:73-2085(-)